MVIFLQLSVLLGTKKMGISAAGFGDEEDGKVINFQLLVLGTKKMGRCWFCCSFTFLRV